VISSVAEMTGQMKADVYQRYFAGVGAAGDIAPNLHGPGDVMRLGIPEANEPIRAKIENLVKDKPSVYAVDAVKQASREGFPMSPEARK
ncbi:hypothetical protein ABTM50_20160, partial [Acinetobacter baumannii]